MARGLRARTLAREYMPGRWHRYAEGFWGELVSSARWPALLPKPREKRASDSRPNGVKLNMCPDVGAWIYARTLARIEGGPTCER